MFSFLLNFPYTLVGLLLACILGIKSISWDRKHLALVCYTKYAPRGLGYMKNWCGVTLGNVVVLNPKLLESTLQHELVHVEQFRAYPLIFPILYLFELVTKGYRANKFEDEAYKRTGIILG